MAKGSTASSRGWEIGAQAQLVGAGRDNSRAAAVSWIRQLLCPHPMSADETWNLWYGPAAHRCGRCGKVFWLGMTV